MIPIQVSEAEVVRFAVVLFRVSGVLVFAPFFSSRSIPFQVRIVFALVITLALYSSVPTGPLPGVSGLSSLLGLVVSEVMFGLVLGLGVSFVFAALQLAGQIVAFQLGFSIINLIDPSSEVETSVISFLQHFIGLMFFFLLNGHHWFFIAVSESFQYLPVQGIHLQGPVVEEFIRMSARVLTSGLQIAAPVIAVTVISDVAVGLIGRAAPQINILIVGMPLKTLVGFSCMSISFYFLPHFLGEAFSAAFAEISVLLRRLA